MFDFINMDAIILAVATGVGSLLVFAIRFLFFIARKFSQKTSTKIDDKIIDKTESVFRENMKDI